MNTVFSLLLLASSVPGDAGHDRQVIGGGAVTLGAYATALSRCALAEVSVPTSECARLVALTCASARMQVEEASLVVEPMEAVTESLSQALAIIQQLPAGSCSVPDLPMAAVVQPTPSLSPLGQRFTGPLIGSPAGQPAPPRRGWLRRPRATLKEVSP